MPKTNPSPPKNLSPMPRSNPQSQAKSLYLLDISSLFFRSYYAIAFNMKNQKGQPTNAVYGVLKMLDQLSRKHKPSAMICCFDTKEGSRFRKQLYPDYKANRSEMPEDLEAQVPYLKTLMQKLLIPCWEKPGVEADDLIASIAKQAKAQWEVFIVSGDKDFAQIVDQKVFLYDSMKEKTYDPEGVEHKWGLPPSKMQDYLALMGDSSDNIPGVRGIGPKGAVKLLSEYPSLQAIYDNLEHIKPSLRNKLVNHKDMAFLSKKLVNLDQNIPVDKQWFKHKHKSFHEFSGKEKQDFIDFLKELDFKSFLKKLVYVQTESPQISIPSESFQKESTRDNKTLSNIPGKVSGKKLKSVSLIEFKNIVEPYAKIFIGAFEEDFYFSFKKSYCLLGKEELKNLADFLDYKWVRYIGHDLKYFWKLLGVKNPVADWDFMIAGHLLSSLNSPSLDKLFQLYCEVSQEAQLSLPERLYQESLLYVKQNQLLQKEDLLDLYQDIELPLIAVLYEMEKTGFCVDLPEIQKQSKDLQKDLEELEFQIHKLAGEKFNLSSPKQLGVLLFEKWNLPKGRKTKTGYSTDSHELIKIKDRHPIIPLLLEYRELFKLKRAYIDPLIQLRSKKTGRVYTEFKQAVASTGRLSSWNPNLQNIPIRTARGRLIRKAFKADQDKDLICADYSQLELRILAEITDDPNLKKAFEEDRDIHAMTASELFNVPIKEVSSDLRRKSKAVNFGIAYGQGVYGLSETLGITRSESKEIIENYFKKFKKIKDYMESIQQDLTQKNYVKTLYGRKRYFNPEDFKNPRIKAGLQRAAINAPLQGTASDLVKVAMIELNESLSIPILSQVHDELLFEAPKSHKKRDIKEIKTLMEKNAVLKTPLKVNISTGPNWFHLK